jgi:uncharacterized protein YegL
MLIYETAKKKLYVHVVLDRSGSMESCRDQTISALNEYVNGLAKDPEISARVSVSTFDTISIDLVRNQVPASDFKKFSREDFIPRSGTPLFDAIGKTIIEMDKVRVDDNEGVALVILTDGEENSSREHTKDSIKKLIQSRQRDKEWLVTYLGANQDAWAMGQSFGISGLNSMTFNTAYVNATMDAVGASTLRYAKASTKSLGLVSSSYTDSERSASIGEGDKTLSSGS